MFKKAFIAAIVTAAAATLPSFAKALPSEVHIGHCDGATAHYTTLTGNVSNFGFGGGNQAAVIICGDDSQEAGIAYTVDYSNSGDHLNYLQTVEILFTDDGFTRNNIELKFCGNPNSAPIVKDLSRAQIKPIPGTGWSTIRFNAQLDYGIRAQINKLMLSLHRTGNITFGRTRATIYPVNTAEFATIDLDKKHCGYLNNCKKEN